MAGEVQITNILIQDTVRIIKDDSLSHSDSITPAQVQQEDSIASDSTDTFRKYSLNEIDSILQKGELRSKIIDSIQKSTEEKQKLIIGKVQEAESQFKFDSNHIIYAFDTLQNWPVPNFLIQIQKEIQDTLSKKTDFFIHESITADETYLDHPARVGKEKFSPDWFLIVFLLIFIQLARVKLFYGKFITPIVTSLINYQTAHTLFRNKNVQYQRASRGLSTIFFFILSLFLFQVFHYFHLNFFYFSGIYLFLILLVLIIGWYGLKFLVCKLTGGFSQTSILFDEYFHTISLFTKSMGLFLIPVTITIAYVNTSLTSGFVYAGFFLIFIIYLLRIFRLFGLFISKNVSVFYCILYLCALEILPILILIRLVVPIN